VSACVCVCAFVCVPFIEKVGLAALSRALLVDFAKTWCVVGSTLKYDKACVLREESNTSLKGSSNCRSGGVRVARML
jgi:hypothetical protein